MGIDGVQREVNVAAARFASPRASRWFLFAGMILAIVPLPACQRAMSVEEAKKVTTSFSGSSLMAPPRESADILGILDERKTEKAPGLAAAEAKVSQPVPESRDPATLATFFYERGVAARRVGRPQQAVGDLRQALAYARQARVREYRILAHLAWAEEAGGSEDRAIEYLREAIAAVPANDRGWLFGLTHGLVWMLGRRGDLQGAEAALKNLSAVLVESNGWKDTLPRTRQLWNAFLSNGQAFLAEVRGDFAKAEVLYRESAAELAKDPLNAGSYEYDLRLARLGRVLAAQGRLLEGETEARRAVLGAVRRSGRYSLETAIVVNYLTNVMLSQRRYADAERLARAGVEIWEKIGTPTDSILMAFTRGNLGNALQAQGRSRDALAQFEIIRVGLSGDSEAFQKHFSSHMNWGFARLDTGDPRGALGIFEAGLSRSQRLRGENDRSTANWRGAVAIARRATGDRERALAEFKAAVPRLLDPSAVNSAEDQEAIQVSGRGLRDVVLSNYLGMLVDVRGTDLETKTGLDATAEAFRVAEVLRSQAVQRAVGAAAARTAAKDPALADLIRQEQDAARREAALRATLANALSLPAGQQDAQSIGSLRQEVDILRRARLALADQITKGFPEYAKLVNPPPTAVEQARAVLRPGEALITTYVAANRTFVWAVPQSGPIAFSVVALGSSGLGRKIAEIRMALDPGTVQTLGDIPPFDVARAYDLYRWWLALPVCLLGVLSGDMVLYWVGRHWGEQVLNWPLVRLVLSPAREQWLKAAYRRHALKTVVTARHVMGLRAAAFLTAGSASVPFWKFVVADAGAALFGVPFEFGFAYFFTDQIKAIMADVHRAERWLGLAGLLALAAMLVVGVWRWYRRVGTEPLDEEPAEGHSPPPSRPIR